ncbi:MAG: hypothetical protein R2798_04335 [Chitinophagales bacterium]|nr:hypothetical protein [Bacteroidota bacterium]MCB9044279.1 hypothetical protein [Chitinophagales bacterium]
MINFKSLYQLIKTLTRGEKRAFSLFVTKYSKENSPASVRLYEIIDTLDEYDAEDLQKKIEAHDVSKNMSVVRSQLQKMLLTSLVSQYAKSNILAQIFELINNANLLYNRGVLDEAVISIDKARNLAETYEQNELLLYIIQLQLYMGQEYYGMQQAQTIFNEGIENIRYILQLLENQATVQELGYEFYRLYLQIGIPRTKEDKAAFSKLIHSKSLQALSGKMTTKAQLDYYTIFAQYYHVFGEIEKAYQQIQKQLSIVEQKPHIKQLYPRWYITILNNFATISMELGYAQQFKEALKKMEEFGKEKELMNEYLNSKLFLFLYTNKLNFNVRNENFDGFEEYVPKIEKFIQQTDKVYHNPEQAMRICFGVALVYFYQKNWKEAHKWIFNFENIYNYVEKSQLIAYIKVFDVILHFERESETFLQLLIPKTIQFLTKKKIYFQIEEIILTNIQEVINSSNRKERLRIFKNLYDEVLMYYDKNASINNDPYKVYIRIDQWALQKITQFS